MCKVKPDVEAFSRCQANQHYNLRVRYTFLSCFPACLHLSRPRWCVARLTVQRGRWHTSRSKWLGQRAIKLSVASEETWKRGETYRSLHIVTKNNELTGEYLGWTCGKVVQHKWLDYRQWESSPIAAFSPNYKRDVIFATLRDVRKPATPILRKDLLDKKPGTNEQLTLWRNEKRSLAIEKYGATSEQAYICSKEAYLSWRKNRKWQTDQGDGNLAWLPTWETIMSLGSGTTS